MKTQKELILFYTKNLEKVSQSHGFDNDYMNFAFFLLQAVKVNVPQSEIFKWATNKCNSLKQETLSLI